MSPVVVVLPESGPGICVGGTSVGVGVSVSLVVVVVTPESALVVGVGVGWLVSGGGGASGLDGVVIGVTSVLESEANFGDVVARGDD